jgi:hypothetical protein
VVLTGGGGRVGRARASPAPEPSLGLARHVNLERPSAESSSIASFGGVLVIADGGNPAVVGLEVRLSTETTKWWEGVPRCRQQAVEKALVNGISGAVAVAGIKG